jgi:hypothetical protein
MYYEDLIHQLELSDEDDGDDDPHLIKNAGQYLQPRVEKKNMKNIEVKRENEFFNKIHNKYQPQIGRYNKKWQK